MIEFNQAPAWVEDVDERRFVCWGWRDKDGKRTKPPLKPGGEFASTSNPKTWRTLSGALKALERQAVPLDGIGYVMTDDTGIIAFDLDKCRNPKTGELAPWARELLARSNTYAELTPSGEGVRAIGLAPAGWRSKVHKPSIPMSDGGSLEIYYHTERYITVTGSMVPGAPEELTDISAIADEFLDPEVVERVANGADDAGAPSLNELVDTVWKISPEIERGDWVKVGHAIKAAGEVWPEDAEKLWLEWCASSEDYGEANGEGAAQAAWDSFKPTRAGYGTLVWYSQEFPASDDNIGPPKDNPRDKSTTGPRVLTSIEFANEFTPPDYIVDQLIQQGYVNSLTGRTGEGKTALCLYIAFCVARGVPFCGHDTECGTVLYLAGENADDVRVRAIVMADRMGTKLDKLDILWITAPYDIKKWHNVVAEKIAGHTIKLVIVDTASAYFPGDDENNNKQAGDYARLIRALFTALPGKPAVLVACHPTKRASDNDLIPRGGGAFLAEVDGNFTVTAEDDETMELSWCTKLRAPGCDPITLRLLRDVTCAQCEDTKGRPLRTAVAAPMTGEEVVARVAERRADQDTLIDVMALNPASSIRDWAEFCGWQTGKDNLPHKSKVYRLLNRLSELRFAAKDRAGQWSLTEKGRSLSKNIAEKANV